VARIPGNGEILERGTVRRSARKEPGMDKELLNRVLTKAVVVDDVVLLHPYGGVFAGQEPVDLAEVIEQACDDEDEYQLLCDTAFEDLGIEPLFDFYWDGAGPGLASAASLDLLRLDRRGSFVVLRDELFGSRVFAAVTPSFEATMFETLLGTNGTSYGAVIFDALPSDTINHNPRLVPEQSVRLGYRQFLDWATAHNFSGDWAGFMDEILRRIFETDLLARLPQLLVEVPDVHQAGAVAAWLSARADDAASLPEQSKQLLLDEYFKRRYEEVRRAR